MAKEREALLRLADRVESSVGVESPMIHVGALIMADAITNKQTATRIREIADALYPEKEKKATP